MASSSHNDRQRVEYGDQRAERGQDGETHQVAAEGAPRLTTQQGRVVSDDQNTLRAGERGPSAWRTSACTHSGW
jgi:catalase